MTKEGKYNPGQLKTILLQSKLAILEDKFELGRQLATKAESIAINFDSEILKRMTINQVYYVNSLIKTETGKPKDLALQEKARTQEITSYLQHALKTLIKES